jgi:hypothetical protein
MSIRVKRAIGWGLDHATFLAHQTLGVGTRDSAISEALEDRFTDAGDAGLTLTREELRILNARPAGTRSPDDDPEPPAHHIPVVEPRLLALKLSVLKQDPLPLGNAYDLYSTVTDGDRPIGILFYPDLLRRERWFHFDDDVDYAFARARSDEPESFLTPVALGHHPWTQDLMDGCGRPIAWFDRTPETLPAIPATIRWYLAKLRILDEAGILALRPVIAQWWS